MSQEQKLEAFIDAIGLRYFRGHELTYYWSSIRSGVKNSIPPEALWPNIIKPLVIADKLRELSGGPITITSSYRSPAYNAALAGAASGSFHKLFKALDLVPHGITPSSLHDLALQLRGTKLSIPKTNQSFIWHGGI